MMGCRQVVRHQVLVLAFGGSNPSIPANLKRPNFCLVFLIIGASYPILAITLSSILSYLQQSHVLLRQVVFGTEYCSA
jgi:hypothetical protein